MTGVIFATLFTWWTPNAFLPAESVDRLSVALATATAGRVSFVPTLTPVGMQPPPGTLPPAATKIGIVSGHRGNHPATGLPDPGAVCADGLTTEQAIVEVVAEETAELLRGHGYQVEVLDEWDARLPGYSAAAMVSIHADSCEYINDFATGFKVASFVGSQTLDQDAKLVSCLITRYAETTGMPFHPSVTRDMTEYHTFAEVGRGTPGAIIEIGFLYLDRQTLTEHPDVIALGVARGLLCYLRAEEIAPENIATPSPEP
jgi:N-acetylmuramoyl-L-alanine amidase